MAETKQKRELAELENRVQGLKHRLDDAWWNEEPLETIMKLEKEIADRLKVIQSAR